MILNGICCLCVRHGCSVSQVSSVGEREQAMCNAKGKSRLSRRRLFAWALPTQLNSPMRVKPSAHYGRTPKRRSPFAAGYTRFFVPHIPSLSPVETTPGSTQHIRLSSRTSLKRVGERLASLHAEEKLLVRPDAAQQHALVEVEGIGMERDTRSRSQQEEHTRQVALIEREVFGYEERLGHALELR